MRSAVRSDDDFKVPRVAAVLRHSVTESIRNAILIGRFQPGERLPERELCEMTGVSRTLVREALRQLESERLIKVIPHRGPIVEDITPEQADGVYRVREELEGLASQLFAERATPQQMQALKAAFENLKTAQDGDTLTKIEAKSEFYRWLLEGAGNEALTNTLRLLNSQVILLRTMSMQAPGRSAKTIAELDDLMVALEERDGKAARRAGSRHVRNAAKVAIRLLEQAWEQRDADAAPSVSR